MTKKKRELIEILLDNITPDDWPEDAKFAAQDKKALSWGKNKLMFYKQDEPPFVETGATIFSGHASGDMIALPELCKHWSKTIVTRDDFVKRWDEHNAQNDNKPTSIGRITWNNGKFIFDDFIESPIYVKYCDEFVKLWNERNARDDKKPDADGWIQCNGGEMPVEKGTLIDVKYRNGLVNLHVAASGGWPSKGSIPEMAANRWVNRNADSDIIAYRLHVLQEQKTPQQLALEKFGTGWHENEGRMPRTGRALIDIEFSNGSIYESELASYWAWEPSQSTHITRWRIHSETNATTPPAQQEAHTEETKPIQQEVKATDTQIGGDHYTKLAIQPMQYSMENGLDPLQHTIIKYVTRFRDKAGIEDLEKAKHCIDMLIEYEKESK